MISKIAEANRIIDLMQKQRLNPESQDEINESSSYRSSPGSPHSYRHTESESESCPARALQIQHSNLLGSMHSARSHAASLNSIMMNTHKLKDVKKQRSNENSFVTFANENWNLVLHMLFGIRQSCHSVMHEEVYELTETEFSGKFRYELDSIKTQKSGKHISYEFYDFAPKMFHLIRQFYGYDTEKYLRSIGPENVFG